MVKELTAGPRGGLGGPPDRNMLRHKKRMRIRQYLPVYLMLIPVMLWFLVFKIIPIYGIQLAFKNYNVFDGVWKSQWVGLDYFKQLFSSYYFSRILVNTLVISVTKLVTAIPTAVLFALLLSEVRSVRFKRITQTISYLPYFISWVTAAGVIMMLLSPQYGVVAAITRAMGGTPVYFLGEPGWFQPMLVITNIWKYMGWDSIIYIATLSGVNPELYEAASIDGASRFRRVLHISLPALLPTVIMLLIINLGSVLSAGFDQVVNLYNSAVYSTGDIIDTYVYREGFVNSNYGFSTAVGLFKSIIAFAMVMGANSLSRRLAKISLW